KAEPELFGGSRLLYTISKIENPIGVYFRPLSFFLPLYSSISLSPSVCFSLSLLRALTVGRVCACVSARGLVLVWCCVVGWWVLLDPYVWVGCVWVCVDPYV